MKNKKEIYHTEMILTLVANQYEHYSGKDFDDNVLSVPRKDIVDVLVYKDGRKEIDIPPNQNEEDIKKIIGSEKTHDKTIEILTKLDQNPDFKFEVRNKETLEEDWSLHPYTDFLIFCPKEELKQYIKDKFRSSNYIPEDIGVSFKNKGECVLYYNGEMSEIKHNYGRGQTTSLNLIRLLLNMEPAVVDDESEIDFKPEYKINKVFEDEDYRPGEKILESQLYEICYQKLRDKNMPDYKENKSTFREAIKTCKEKIQDDLGIDIIEIDDEEMEKDRYIRIINRKINVDS
jgi:hypothetical protein